MADFKGSGEVARAGQTMRAIRVIVEDTTLSDERIIGALSDVLRDYYSAPAPRVWRRGDPEPPAEVTAVTAPDGARAQRHGTGWWWTHNPDGSACPGPETVPHATSGWSWQLAGSWPLVEVVS